MAGAQGNPADAHPDLSAGLAYPCGGNLIPGGAMVKYVFHDGKVRPWPEAAAMRRPPARSELACPYVVGDRLDDVLCPADGKRYDSKSKYYLAVKAAGCEIVGNEAAKMVEMGQKARSCVQRDEVGDALAKVKQGYTPGPLEMADPEIAKMGGLG